MNLRKRAAQLEKDLHRIQNGANTHKVNNLLYVTMAVSDGTVDDEWGMEALDSVAAYLVAHHRKVSPNVVDIDTRRFPRRESTLPATCWMGASIVSGAISNLSAGGACFQFEVGYVDGVLGTVSDFCSDGDEVDLEVNGALVCGVVRWSDDNSLGIEYVVANSDTTLEQAALAA